MSSIDDDQRETEKTRSEPDRATTEAALRSSDHTTVDYSRFDAVEVPEENQRLEALVAFQQCVLWMHSGGVLGPARNRSLQHAP